MLTFCNNVSDHSKSIHKGFILTLLCQSHDNSANAFLLPTTIGINAWRHSTWDGHQHDLVWDSPLTSTKQQNYANPGQQHREVPSSHPFKRWHNLVQLQCSNGSTATDFFLYNRRWKIFQLSNIGPRWESNLGAGGMAVIVQRRTDISGRFWWDIK